MDIRPAASSPQPPGSAAEPPPPAAARAPSPARARVGVAGAPERPPRRESAAATPHGLAAMADPRVRGEFPTRLRSQAQLAGFEQQFAPEVHHQVMASYLSQLPREREALVFPVNVDAISRLNIDSLRSAAQIPALAHARCPEGYPEKEMLNWCAERLDFAAATRRHTADLCMKHPRSDGRMHALDGLMDSIRGELSSEAEVLLRAGSGEHGVLVELRTIDAARMTMTIFNPGHGLDHHHDADPARPAKYSQAFTTVFPADKHESLVEDMAHHLLVQNEIGNIDELYKVAQEGTAGQLYAVRYQQTQKGKDCLDESINAYLKHRLGDLGYQAAKYTKLSSVLERAAPGPAVAEGSQFPTVSGNGVLALHGPQDAAAWNDRVQAKLELRVFNTGQRLLAAIDRAMGRDVGAAQAARTAETLPEQAALVAGGWRELAAARGAAEGR